MALTRKFQAITPNFFTHFFYPLCVTYLISLIPVAVRAKACESAWLVRQFSQIPLKAWMFLSWVCRELRTYRPLRPVEHWLREVLMSVVCLCMFLKSQQRSGLDLPLNNALITKSKAPVNKSRTRVLFHRFCVFYLRTGHRFWQVTQLG
jgi:hypothetical protein